MEARKKLNESIKLRFTIQLALLLILSVFISSCSHVRRDGPPSFYVDETKIPNAVPKPEPLSKYNLPVYRVKGKTYNTLKSSKNFQEVGIASWYGTLFHERRTSSGERYDMLAMTAAHKTLPLPTYVEVLNLKNKRKIIVKVNDRGPFKENRIIDLSYVAAKKLGMIGRGTTYVKITAIDPYQYQRHLMLAKQEAAPTATTPRNIMASATHTIPHKKTHYLAVGTFKNRNNALRIKNELRHKLDAPVLITQSKGARYLVQIGPLENTRSVALMKKRLAKIRTIY